VFSVSQSTGYAILALTCLESSPDKWVLAKDIAACTEVPPSYLAKILHLLRKSGLVDAKRGYRGGVRLARPPAEINLLDVTLAIEGRSGLTDCVLNLSECSEERACPSHRFWEATRQRIRQQLERISLSDMVSFERRWQGSRLKCSCVYQGDGHRIVVPRDSQPPSHKSKPRQTTAGRKRTPGQSTSAPAKSRRRRPPRVHGGSR
jgi:Rrf2 family protein